MSETNFIAFLTSVDKIRHHHISIKGKIIEFSVQYEAFIFNKWQIIIRYDTAHGFAHIDRMLPDGTVEKIPLLYWNYNEALTFAQYDIKSNWELYREKIKKEMKK